MDEEFNDISEAMMDLMIDHLHEFAELEQEDELETTGSVAQLDRATAF
tara:strand:- start:243 stop:386 length:144 start_codon:yes stop_codon:yes gene_type:complete